MTTAIATKLTRELERMNGTEREYAQFLEAHRRAGIVAFYAFEGVTLKLGDDLRYTPDFLVVLADGTIELHETKGFWRDDAKVKIRAAARLFPFVFRAFRKRPKKEGGGWAGEEF